MSQHELTHPSSEATTTDPASASHENHPDSAPGSGQAEGMSLEPVDRPFSLASLYRQARISTFSWQRHDFGGMGEESGRYLYAPEAAEMFGCSLAQLHAAQDFFNTSVLHPSDRERHIKEYRDFWVSPRLINTQEFRILHPRHGTRHIRVTSEKQIDDHGQLCALTGTLQDITDFKMAVNAKRSSDAMIQRTYRMMKIGHWSFTPSAGKEDAENGIYIYSNEAERVLGITKEDLNLSIDGFAERFIHPEDRAGYITSYREFWHSNDVILHAEYRFQHPSGRFITIHEVTEKVFDADGHLIEIAGTLQDITEERLAQAALRQNEIKLRRGFRMAKLIHWTYEPFRYTDEKAFWRYTYSSEVEEIYGRTAEELIQFGEQFYSVVIHPEDQQKLRELNDKFLIEDRTSYIHDYRIVRPSGEIRYLRESAEKVLGTDGHLLQILGTVQDLTDLRLRELEMAEAKNAAERANRSKSEFLANMSHELRTPLNAIIGFSQVIRDQFFGPNDERYVDYARDIHDSGDHLLKLISNLLDMSKLESGKQELVDDIVDPPQEIDACLKMVANRAAEKNIRIYLDPVDKPIKLRVDQRALKQVIINLLSNAIKFTEPGGTVRIVPERTEAGYSISVTDTGIGIDPEVIPTLFHPFQQGSAVINRRFGGTGLGLYISRRLMEGHQGTISATSYPGCGTTMRILFPVERLIPDDGKD